MDSCRYVHWVLEDPGKLSSEEQERRKTEATAREKKREGTEKVSSRKDLDHSTRATKLICVRLQALPPQWVNADLRQLDVSVLGKYDVVVADPPWAIHQEVNPYSLAPSS